MTLTYPSTIRVALEFLIETLLAVIEPVEAIVIVPPPTEPSK